jgi:hypothetical protein
MNRQGEFRLAVSHDYDGDCSVDVTIVAGAFQGSGHAWLNIRDITEFAQAVQNLATTSKGQAFLRGGYASNDGTHHTVDVNLRPHGSRGHLLLTAELASDPISLDAQIFVVSRITGGVIVEPAALARFAQTLTDIPKGTGIEAVVRGESAA